jgi:hypothetical protein
VPAAKLTRRQLRRRHGHADARGRGAVAPRPPARRRPPLGFYSA